MEIAIVGIPLFYGCDICGVEQAPRKLREMGLVERLSAAGHSVEDCGDVAVDDVCADDKYAAGSNMKYLAPVSAACRELSGKVTSILREGKFPLIIGGDHSHGIGTISGVSRVFGPDTAVVWIDSHSDIHRFATSPSGNIHGVPLGAAIGLDCGPLNEVFDPGSNMKGKNIFIIGLRSYEPEEIEIMDAHGVNRYSVDDVRRLGIDGIFEDISEKLQRNGAIALHLSFDVDSLDPSIAPGTGIREPDGLTEQEAAAAIRAAFATGLVCSMDFSELNPSRDRNDMTSLLSLRLLDNIPL